MKGTPTVFILQIFIFLASSKAFGLCSEGDVIDSSANKIAAGRISDHVGYCTHHASRDLLHQEICGTAKSTKDCFQPAVTEFLAVDAMETNSEKYYRNTSDALRRILARKTAAAEECLNLTGLFPPNPETKNMNNYGEKFSAAISGTILIECEKQGLNSAKCQTEIKTPDGFDKYMYAAINRYKREKNCPEKSFPSIFIRETKADLNGLTPAENLHKLLRSGYQAKVVIAGPHAIVISNYRMICIGGKETLQYQTLDSLHGTKWSKSKGPADWVDGDSLIKSLDKRIPFLTIEKSEPSHAGESSDVAR